MRKTFILDTSVLVQDPYVFEKFTNGDVIIPAAVLNELDDLKKNSNDAGKNARVAIRLLDELTTDEDLSKGIDLEGDIKLFIDTNYFNIKDLNLKSFGNQDYGDTQILVCAYMFKSEHPDTEVTLVTNDINLKIKARSRGINAESHLDKKSSLNDLYSGVQVVKDVDAGIELQQNGSLDPRLFNIVANPHECILFEDDDGNAIALGRKVNFDKVKLIKKSYPWKISAKNKEQAFAIDLIMDRGVDLVTMVGKAGSGKSLIALAAALELVLNKKEYDKLIIYRPIQSVGNDIGYLPGPQPLSSKIMTPSGWTTMGDIQPDDFVIGSDGTSKKVLKIFPKGEKEVFKVMFSDGSYTECCEDHLWYTTSLQESQRKNGVGSVKSLKEIRATLKVYKTQINNHKIPMINPVFFNKKETVINPYIMGVLLGYGTLSEQYSIYFTSSDNEMYEHCSACLPDNMLCKIKNQVKNSFNYSFIMKENEKCQHRIDNIFNAEIKKYGLLGTKSNSKFIPEDYKINDIESRIAILQGLMDTDGFVSEDGSDVSYSTTSEQLALDVQFIVQSLGGLAKINDKKSTYVYDGIIKELNSKVVSISLPNGICPFRLSRKVNRFKSRKYDLHRMIVDIVSVGMKETKCILVDSEDHLYATDYFILTHNTMEEKLAPWFQAIMDNFEFLFSNKDNHSNNDWKKDLEMYQRKDRIEMDAITYIRGRSIPNSVMLIDEAQNLTKDEIKTILTRAGEGTKIILNGDIDQIDNSDLDALNNGLTYVIEKFKTSELAGHVTFVQGERSRLASKAAEIL